VTTLAEPATLLDAWDYAAQVPSPARGAVLVYLAGLTGTLDEALDLDVGRCAALALQAHREAFGLGAPVVVGCPTCGDLLEGQWPALDRIVVNAGADDRDARERVVGQWVVRAPTTRDLLVAARQPDSVREVLLDRCVRACPAAVADGAPGTPAGAAVPATPSSYDLAGLDAAAEDLAGVGALVSVASCPGCGETVEAAFDVGAVLWEAVSAAATALLSDVAILARAFGWDEADVVALPDARRHAYLELALR